MRIVLHREIPDDPHLQTQWNALIEQMESPEVFYTYQWSWAVQRAYASTLVPFLVLAYEGESLIGVASLATDPGGRTASFLAGTTADYCEFLSHPANRAPLADAVVSELKKAGIRRIQLANLPADSATAAAIRDAAKRSKYHAFFRTAYLCARVELGQREERVSLKSEHLRKTMFRRSLNRMGKEGIVALNHARSWNEVEAILPGFAVAHVARFLATGRISNLASAARRVFLEELAKALSCSNWLTLTRLMVGDQSVAWNYGFQFEGSWFWYQPTFDTKFEALSPGHCLLTHIVAEACDMNEMRVVDLGLGAEGYKERLANSNRMTLHGILSRSPIDHMIAVLRYRLSCLVKSSPRIEAMLRTTIARWRAIGSRAQKTGVRGLFSWGLKRVQQLLFLRDEVLFYSWPPDSSNGSRASRMSLVGVSLELMAAAAIRFEGDTDTYDYLLRSARRFRERKDRGFALLNSDGNPVHFCWVGEFEGFSMDELNTRLETPTLNAAMIFDCWTPVSARRHGYYALAVGLTAQTLVREGRDPWIFSAVKNDASIRGLEAAGFEPRYSLVRQRILMRQKITKLSRVPLGAPEMPVGSSPSAL